MPLSSGLMADEIEKNILNGAANGGNITMNEWATVLQNYFSQATFPPAGGPGMSAAKSAFISSIPDLSKANIILFKTAFFTFGSTLALTAVGTSGLPSSPPVGLPLLEVAFPAGMANVSIPKMAKVLGTILHGYFKTQLYFNGTTLTPAPTPFT